MKISVRHIFFYIVIFYFSSIGNCRRILHVNFDSFSDSNLNYSSEAETDNYQVEQRLLSDDPEVHRVTSLPGLVGDSLIHYAGYITVVPSKGSNIFYWLFETPKNPLNAPLLIWLNGGPGCSSMDGLFLELGPLRLEGQNVKINQYSWHNVANIIFIDQPVGTGLSFTKSKSYATNDEMINEQFYTFLVEFLKLHNRYTYSANGQKTSRKIFFSGESHAGHYIPSMAAYILGRNQKLSSKDEIYLDIAGLAIGNGWIDPTNQYDVSDFAHGLGLITIGQKNKMKAVERVCLDQISKGRYNHQSCFSLLDDVIASTALGNSNKVLMYDARKYVQNTRSFPPGHEAVESYLNKQDVRKAIHATASVHAYVECADPPYNALSAQDGKGVTEELKLILNSGLPVLHFSGQFDIICHHLGTERLLSKLDWEGKAGWLSSQPGVWLVDGQPAGYLKSYKNLQSLVVLDSGHMVPMDKPKQALMMIQRFLQGQSLSSGNTKIGVSLDAPDKCISSSKTSFTTTTSTANHNNQITPLLPAPAFSRDAIAVDSAIWLSVTIPAAIIDIQDKNKASGYYFLVTTAQSGSDQRNTMKFPITTFGGITSQLFVSPLPNGVRHIFTVQIKNENSDLASQVALITATPGCYRKDYLQCCGRGICGMDAATSVLLPVASMCHCDSGYRGQHCEINSIDESVECPLASATSTIIDKLTNSSSESSKNIMNEDVGKVSTITNSFIQSLCKDVPSSGYCMVVVEVNLGHRPISSLWTSPEKFPLYRDSIMALLLTDIQSAIPLATVYQDSHQDRAKLRNSRNIDATEITTKLKIAISVDVSQYQPQSESSNLKEQHISSALTSKLFIQGAKSVVLEALISLRSQIDDSLSPLRNGVLTSASHPILKAYDSSSALYRTRDDSNWKNGNGKGPGATGESEMVLIELGGAKRKYSLLTIFIFLFVISIIGAIILLQTRNKKRFKVGLENQKILPFR